VLHASCAVVFGHFGACKGFKLRSTTSVARFSHTNCSLHAVASSAPDSCMKRRTALAVWVSCFEQKEWKALLASPMRALIPCELATILNDVYFRQSDIVRLEVRDDELAVVESSVDPSKGTQHHVPKGDWSMVVVGYVLNHEERASGFPPAVFEVGVNPQRMFGLRMGDNATPVLTSITASNATPSAPAEPWDCIGPLDMFIGPGPGFRSKRLGGARRPAFSK
jgi:hypothetical protein